MYVKNCSISEPVKKCLLKKELKNIYNLAIFLAVFYTKQWLISANTGYAPSNDLELLRKLTKAKDCIRKSPKGWPRLLPLLVKKARKKIENHLWYLLIRLVFLSFFSDNVTISEKQQLRRAMIKYQGKSRNKQEMPVSANLGQKSHTDFVGKQSWTAFQLLRLDSSFVSLPVAAWKTTEGYEHAKLVESKLPVVNDVTERALGLATETNSKTCPRTEAEHYRHFTKSLKVYEKN